MLSTKTLAAVAALSLSIIGQQATAATLTANGSYEATEVESKGIPHSFWLPALPGNAYFRFVDGVGDFKVTDDGATLKGSIYQRHSSKANTFDVDVSFSFLQTGTSADVKGKCYTASCAAISGDWDFFKYESATLTGTGGIFDGVTLELSERPTDGTAPPQLGEGANDKNAGLGFSSWFFYEWDGKTQKGDINLNLDSVSAVPLPAGSLLLLTGLGGLAFARRRKQS